MTFKKTQLWDAMSCALAIGAITVAGTGIAFAQQTSPAAPAATDTKATDLDRIEVTGTRIRQVDVETAQPVLVISRQDIEKQGFQSVADILQNVSAVGTPPISRASPLSAGENAGGTFISLRNLGAQRTLVLVNGKRLGISTSGLSDISTIPAVAVERIEVLKDGASSVYGSDAIAGVINIITRSNFEGAAASAYFGQYSQGDGSITKGDFVMGVTGERGSLTAAAEWAKEDAVFASDRGFAAFPRSDLHPDLGWTTVGQQGGFTSRFSEGLPNVIYVPASATNPNRNTRVMLREGGDPANPADYRNQNTSSTSILDKSNTNLQTDLRTPLERKSLYVDGVLDISDNIRFRTNLLYSNRVTERTVAGYPMQAASFNTPMSADSYFNPLSTPISTWWRRTWEVPRVSDSDLTTYRFTGAFEGSFEFADRTFDWDVAYLHNSNKLVQSTFGNLNLPNTRAAVGPSFLNAQGVVQCGTAIAPIALSSCVPFNPFLPFGTEGQGGLTNNQALQNFLFQEEHNTGETTTQVINANLAGSLFSLPAGDLAFAVGVETRKEDGEFVPDALAVTGASTNLAAGPTGGGYTVDEIYAELQVPILADLPFARELSISLASRYSDYDTFGDTTNSKFGFKWKPIDSLLFRGTWSEGFRAPTISDLYGGGSQTFAFYLDPCDTQFGASKDPASATRARCVADLGAAAATFRQLGQGFTPITANPSQTPVAFTSGSNPLLEPEFSTSKTLGLVWSPGFLEGLNVSLDWWNILIENTVVTDTPTTKLNDCYVLGIASRCVGFTRDPAQGYIDTMLFGTRNAGYREIEGFDFDVAYRLTTDNWGKFNAVFNSTYTSKDVTRATNDPVPPSVNLSFGSNFRIRANLNLGWEMGAFGASWTARYFSAIKEACLSAAAFPDECNDPNYRAPDTGGVSPQNRTGSNTFHDLQVRWNAPWNATVAVGANNVFEHYGPVLYSQPSANVSYYGGFDIGRFIYMKYTQRF